MSPPDLDALLGNVRRLTTRYKSGRTPDSFLAFRELVDFLLRTTVLAPEGGINLSRGPRGDQPVFLLGGWRGPDDPVPLTDGGYLRISMVLFLEDTPAGPRVKVQNSSVQYQLDPEGSRWIFRYDYIREPPDPQPASHLHVRAQLLDNCLAAGIPLERLHFPTQRVSIEAILRFMIEQFGLTPNNPDKWRAVLAESERLFLEIAHRSPSVPPQ